MRFCSTIPDTMQLDGSLVDGWLGLLGSSGSDGCGDGAVAESPIRIFSQRWHGHSTTAAKVERYFLAWSPWMGKACGGHASLEFLGARDVSLRRASGMAALTFMERSSAEFLVADWTVACRGNGRGFLCPKSKAWNDDASIFGRCIDAGVGTGLKKK